MPLLAKACPLTVITPVVEMTALLVGVLMTMRPLSVAGNGLTTWLVQLPASLGTIGVGARIAAATAPIGAIVGEWVGASGGLGYLMLHANARMQIPTVFAALFCLLVFTLSLYGLVNFMTRKLLFWTEER